MRRFLTGKSWRRREGCGWRGTHAPMGRHVPSTGTLLPGGSRCARVEQLRSTSSGTGAGDPQGFRLVRGVLPGGALPPTALASPGTKSITSPAMSGGSLAGGILHRGSPREGGERPRPTPGSGRDTPPHTAPRAPSTGSASLKCNQENSLATPAAV